jgi:hypothetical protein
MSEEYVGNGLWRQTDEYAAYRQPMRTKIEPLVTIQGIELLPSNVSVLREALAVMQEKMRHEISACADSDLDRLRDAIDKEFAVKFILEVMKLEPR